ncbi:MAG: transglutaminase-like domain-containing protein [Pirellulaceae bacterium]|nr:transglutaminase-like domain-containing protein [Pirellulaceae bacterium]
MIKPNLLLSFLCRCPSPSPLKVEPTLLVLLTQTLLFLLTASYPVIAEDPPNTPSIPKTKKEKVVLEADPQSSVQYWAHRNFKMRFGLQFQSNDNHCRELYATIPFPRNWPEQQVKILGADLPDFSRYKERELPAGAKQLLLEVPALAAHQQLDVVITVEIVKSFIKLPEDTSSLIYPKKTIRDKDLQWSLGDSPFIDTKSRQIRAIAKEIKDKEPESAWKHVELIYDWVRDNIQYRNGSLRTTQDALKDKFGDCEEMTGVFVAICRASNIPARCVWIPQHCYPEFYLEDANGFGHWFPCQAAGDRQFGEMNEYRPILQKGDRFKVPEEKQMQRYVAEYFTCKQRSVGPTPPNVDTIRDLGELQAELQQIKAATEPPAS